ncbi:MAG TPA: carboxypeptidase-like regulatory domain-containing protein [Bryobacteraceae bacterium]
MHRCAAWLLVFAPVIPVMGLVHAQNTEALEISGVVMEPGFDGTPSLPVGGVEVTLSEFVLVDNLVTRAVTATVYTDPRGAYQFHPLHLGDYYIEVRKEGYSGVAPGTAEFIGASVKLDPAHPSTQMPFTITRRGGLTGRVIDEDGNPVPGLHLTVQPSGPTGMAKFLETAAVTAADGTFSVSNLLPGPHVVRISPRAGELEKLDLHFSSDDLKTIDRDLETAYWPGGTAVPSASIPVSPGASASAGDIKIREASYYRVYVSVPRVECAPGEMWAFLALDSGGEAMGVSSRGLPQIACANDFLVSNLRPGAYWFMLRKDEPDPGRWALASVDISNKNLDVALTMEPEAEINGRFIAADGATLPPLENIGVSTKPAIVGFAGGGASPVRPDAEGKFVLTNLKFPRHQILVSGLTRQYYIKEYHFNGEPSDGFVTVNPGAAQQLEIVIDDKPGAIAGTVTDGDKPAARSLVTLFSSSLQPAESFLSNQGTFQFIGVAPGQYRAVAVALLPGAPEDIDAMTRLAARAETITVERGSTQTVSLKLTGPSK